MEYRQLGHSGLRVPVLSFGTCTFGGNTEFFSTWGNTTLKQASRLVDICFDAGVNFFDTADVYSAGTAETILGGALKGKRDRAIISTKGTFAMGDGSNDTGSSRKHLIEACDNSLKRLGTDYIDVYFMHGFDTLTPVDETLATLDNLIQSGKVRYIGCSNFSGWQVMKSLATSEKYGLARYVVYQGYYSLIGREYEWELMPLGVDQDLGLMVWSPLGWARLTGKIERNQPMKEGRIKLGGAVGGPKMSDEYLYAVIDTLNYIANETGKTIPQIALKWLLQRPTVCNIVLGARDEKQLIENLPLFDWQLSVDHIKKLDAVSRSQPIYPYWHQSGFEKINPVAATW